MAITLDLRGRRALVTGAGQGVGRGIALTLAAAGAEVGVNDLVRERAERRRRDHRGRRFGPCRGLRRHRLGRRAGRRRRVGPYDILVNNAGNAGRPDTMGTDDLQPFVEQDLAPWSGFVGVNLFGVMHATRAALPAMIEAGRGKIVTIVSDSARTGDANVAAYAASKAGAAGLMRSIAREVGRNGITANSISLGSINAMETPRRSKRSS